jgi:hypothetical protein
MSGKTHISRDDLRAEREQVKSEIATHRRFVARSRDLIAKAREIYDDSVRRVRDSRKLVERR